MRATVTNLFGTTEVCEIIDLDDGHYSIKFIPREMGLHTVVVQHKNVHIPGTGPWMIEFGINVVHWVQVVLSSSRWDRLSMVAPTRSWLPATG